MMVRGDILNGVLKHSHVCICAYVLRGDTIASSEVLKKKKSSEARKGHE